MTPDNVGEILRRLDRQDGHLADQTRRLERIEQHAEKTNGRVNTLELWQARIEGAKWAVSWAPALMTGMVCAVLGGTVGAVLAALL